VSPAPRILVTASFDDPVGEYLDALREAGAAPVRVDASSDPAELMANARGLLVTGGVDVAPARYGAPRSPFVTAVEPERDAFEIALLRAARERGLPTLAICRGIQIANVAFGGTLIDDIPHAQGERAAIRHAVGGPGQQDRWQLVPEHVVSIEPDSLLARVVGTTRLVTSATHHQAVDRCAADLRVAARTGDGIVEALEARFKSPFWLAVQWHPESNRAEDGGASRALFAAFARACGGSSAA
jgi:putative glutamine amidotransferase